MTQPSRPSAPARRLITEEDLDRFLETGRLIATGPYEDEAPTEQAA